MLPDDWKDWKTCTNDNFYVRLGLDHERASAYTVDDIEAAFRERRDWWAQKPRYNPLWAEKIRLAEGALSEARATLTSSDKKRAYDQGLREELAKKQKEEHEKKIKDFLEIFKDNVYSAIHDGWLEPKKTRHLLDTAKKYGIPEDVARKTIDECLKKKGAKRGKKPPSNLPSEMDGKNYYEILGISEDANTKQIQEGFRKQFNVWHSQVQNPTFRVFVTPAKDELLKARDTLLDDKKRREYNQELKQKDLEEEIILLPGGTAKPVLEVDKDNFSFDEVRIGSVLPGTITINNVGDVGSVLSGPIKSNVPWLKVSPHTIDTTKLSQKITFSIYTSGLARGNSYSGIVEIQSNAGKKSISIRVSTEKDEVALSRFRSGLTFGGLSVGGLFGYLVYNLNFIQGMNVNVAGKAGIVALICTIVAAGWSGYKAEGGGAAFGCGCGTLIVGAIILYILSYFPHALSTFSWSLAYGSFGNLLSTPIRQALWRGDRKTPITIAAVALALTVGIIILGFVSAKEEKRNEALKQAKIQSHIRAVHTELPGEWYGNVGNNKAHLLIGEKGGRLFGKIYYQGIEEKLSVGIKNDEGHVFIVLKGTDYKRLRGKGSFSLDTFYGTLSADGHSLKGKYVDTMGRKGKWSAVKDEVDRPPRASSLHPPTKPTNFAQLDKQGIAQISAGQRVIIKKPDGQILRLRKGDYVHLEVVKGRYWQLAFVDNSKSRIQLKPMPNPKATLKITRIVDGHLILENTGKEEIKIKVKVK